MGQRTHLLHQGARRDAGEARAVARPRNERFCAPCSRASALAIRRAAPCCLTSSESPAVSSETSRVRCVHSKVPAGTLDRAAIRPTHPVRTAFGPGPPKSRLGFGNKLHGDSTRLRGVPFDRANRSDADSWLNMAIGHERGRDISSPPCPTPPYPVASS